MSFRFYSYVAGGYLSELQKGLQTAHVIADMSVQDMTEDARMMYEVWAAGHKTIIICTVFNSAGVVEQYQKLRYWIEQNKLDMTASLFCEDIQSLNGAPTACGVVVPSFIYDAVPTYQDNRLAYYTVTLVGQTRKYYPSDDLFELIQIIRTPKLA